jgi:pyridoxine 5-phosphate synthase
MNNSDEQMTHNGGDVTQELRLGVNIDHVATVRNARGGTHPDPVRAAIMAEEAGADGITAHLREDRRHIRDADMAAIRAAITIPLNFEMAATVEMVSLAVETMPNAACIVPERREEVTTEGGLAVAGHEARLTDLLAPIKEAGIRLSLFIEASEVEIRAAAAIGADIIELHTGRYCHDVERRGEELVRLANAAKLAHGLGLECHAGHGLDFDTVGAIAAIPEMVELNIGHFLIGESIFTGFPAAIGRMRTLMQSART